VGNNLTLNPSPQAERDLTWRVVGERLLVDRSPYARILEQDVQLPDGQTIHDWVIVDLPAFVIMFATVENGDGEIRVPFVRQYRQAVSSYLLELPAGHLEGDEDPLVGAKRELLEEAGLEASDWQFLGKYVLDPNRHCGWAYVYLARNARQAGPANHGDLGEMTIHMLTLDEVQRALSNGEFVNAPTALCVALALHLLG
jgi:8-oxo-dGTP pyrophosphatase MutT (NUDIX family)